jgi:catechol 2,3-dioxygenase-like lactoylglutathione lyase family enzyme
MHVDHLVFNARDLAASLRHYEALLPILGFTKTRDHVWSNEQAIFCAAGIDVPAPQEIDGAYVVFVPDPDGMRVEVGYDP